MDGDDLIRFEEEFDDSLFEAYVEEKGKVPDRESAEWSRFVLRTYTERQADLEDREADR